MMIMADMPIAKTAALLRCDEKSLSKIMRYWVNKAVDGMSLAEVVKLAIDETSFKRGHKYVTLIIDAAKRRVIDVEPGWSRKKITSAARPSIQGRDKEATAGIRHPVPRPLNQRTNKCENR